MLDHRWDLAADFRAIYRLSPAEALALSGPEYLALCWRLPAYAGALRHQLMNQQEKEGPRQKDVEVVEPTREALNASPFAGLIEGL